MGGNWRLNNKALPHEKMFFNWMGILEMAYGYVKLWCLGVITYSNTSKTLYISLGCSIEHGAYLLRKNQLLLVFHGKTRDATCRS